MTDRAAESGDALARCATLETFDIPCAPGHDVVYGLAAGANNEIYLAASNEFSPGLSAVVFAFDTTTHRFRAVIDVEKETGFEPRTGQLPHSKIHLCLHATRSGRVFAATHFTAPGLGRKTFDPIAAFRGAYPGCHLLDYDPQTDRVTNHGLLVRGEGARIACIDDARGQFYFISYPRNHFFRYDYAARSLHDLGRVGQENAFGLEVGADGAVYTSDDLGRILRYTPERDRLEETRCFVPLAPGRRAAGNYIRRMTRSAAGTLFGFGNKGMRLFAFDPAHERLVDHGAIFGAEGSPGLDYPRLPPAKALVHLEPDTLLIAFGGDGVYADASPVPHLVAYDLRERRTRDLGRFVCPRDGTPAWIPQCALSVPGTNAVFFGLQQTVGPLRLWKVNTPFRAPETPGPLTARYREHCAVIQRQPFGASVTGSDELPFVRRGFVTMVAPGWRGEDRVIPPGESAIAALRFVGDTLYGVTVGRRPHLFAWRPYQQSRFTENYDVHPWDLGVMFDEPVLRARLFRVATGRLLTVLETDDVLVFVAFEPGSELKRYQPVFHSLPHAPPVQWNAPPFQIMARVPRAQLAFENLICLPETGALAGTILSGELVRILPAGALHQLAWSGRVVRQGLVATGPHSLIAITPDSRAFDLQLDATGGAITATERARGVTLGITATAFHDATDTLAYGTAEGRIEIVRRNSPCALVSIELPESWPVRALAWSPTGRLFGFQGKPSGIGEAFAVDANTSHVDRIGILQVRSDPRYWMCHRCDAMTAGPRGEIYFGETDRIGHLFQYVE